MGALLLLFDLLGFAPCCDRGGLLSPDFNKLDAAAQIKIKKKRCLLNSPQPYDIVQVQKIQAVVSLGLLIAGRGHYGY